MAIFNRGIYEGGRDKIVKRLRRKRVQARKMAVEVKCWATGVWGGAKMGITQE